MELFRKLQSAKLFESIHGIINYSSYIINHKLLHHSICPFESGKCGKEGKKSQKLEYLENENSFLDEIKNIFHSF